MNMGHRCCSKQKVKRGLWSPEEDEKLSNHITTHGHGSWSSVPKLAGLQRCGKSCRLRWINYLRPDLKKGSFTQEEEQIIIDVHRILGNRWAQIAKHLPGRTDNEVKNFWNSCIKKKLMSQGLDPQTHNLISSQYSQRVSSNTKNKATKFVVSHDNRHEQEPVSVFSMSDSSHEMMKNNICLSEDRRALINQPFHLTLPINEQYRNSPSCPSALRGQNIRANASSGANFHHYGSVSSIENSTTTPNVSSSSSSSLDVQNLSCFADHDFGIWGNSGFETFDQNPISMEVYNNNQQTLQGSENNVDYDQEQIKGLQQKDKISEIQSDRTIEKNSSSSFDLGYLESALMSDVVCHDLSPMEYDLPWNY